MVRIINISKNPAWHEVRDAEVGDVLVRRKKVVGVVYKMDNNVHFCYTGKLTNVMYLRAFFQSEEGLGSRVSRAVAVSHPVISDEEFNKAQSTYSRGIQSLVGNN